MKKGILFIVGLLCVQLGLSQSVKNIVPESEHLQWADTAIAKQDFCSIQLSSDWTEDEALTQSLKYLGIHTGTFQKSYRRESKLGSFIEFTYAPQGIPAYIHFVKIYIDPKGKIRQISSLLDGVNTACLESFSNPAIVIPGVELSSAKKIWFYNGLKWYAAWEYTYNAKILAFDEKRIYSSAGELLHRSPLAMLNHAPDSMIQAKVFLPDPLTTAGLYYGDTLNGYTYLDYNDADSSGANQQRKSVMIAARIVNDTFILRDTNFYFEELEGPVRLEPRSIIPEFNYTRSQEQFEYVNAMYHLRAIKLRVDTLGFPSLPGFQIMIDAHASNGLDISAFSSKSTPPSLLFGDGGIDDAEDADVIVHEFTHGLSFGAAPNTSNGLERSSFEEGECDYIAMSYSRGLNPFNWQKTFNWDGNATWQGRRANWTGILPDDFSTNKYSNAEIWVSALAEIYDSVGADICDQIVLSGLYHQTTNMSFRSMALSLLQVDTVLFNAAHTNAMFTAFERRRILYPLGIEKPDQERQWTLINSYGFSQGGIVSVYFGGQQLEGEYELYDLKGALIKRSGFGLSSALELSGEDIKKGLYMLRITPTDQVSRSIRLVRY